MTVRIHRKNVLVVCDCIGCTNRPTWIQGFITKDGVVIIDLCEDHHFILRTKVPNEIPLNEDVLKWLLIQDSNPSMVVRYGLLRGQTDIEMAKMLKDINIEYE